MPAVYLMDPDRSFERQFNRNGWPFLMLVDEQGQIVYQVNNLVDNDRSYMRNLQTITKTKRQTETRLIGDIPYLPSTLQNNGELETTHTNEGFTSIACDENGNVYTVYTSVENGNSNVYLRILHNAREPNDIAVAATDADEYDGSVITDAQNQVWICWTGNSRGSTYNVYLTNLVDIQNNKPSVFISQSKEDAMHGRMAADAANNIWITYYKWQMMNNTSRDKEVYLRRYANGSVSGEIHVSPEDVPTYEDHTDPAIAILNNQPVICWSWDYHKPDGYTKDAETPTIFARSFDGNRAVSKPFHVSEKYIDMKPVLEACGDTLWCAWDSLQRNEKSLCVREVTASAASGRILTMAEGVVNVCSPCFAFYNNTKGVLTWSQTENGRDWSLWKADYDGSAKTWGKPLKIISEGNPRFASCDYDARGNLWLAYSAQTEHGRQVKVEQINEQ